MTKLRDNYLAEIIIILVIATMLFSSCRSSYCPYSYKSCDGKKKVKMLNNW